MTDDTPHGSATNKAGEVGNNDSTGKEESNSMPVETDEVAPDEEIVSPPAEPEKSAAKSEADSNESVWNLSWWKKRANELQPFFVAITAVATVIGAIVGFLWVFAGNEVREFAREQIITLLAGNDTEFLQSIPDKDMKDKNYLLWTAMLEEKQFRDQVIRSLSGFDDDYTSQLASEISGSQNLLELILDPPAVADLKRKIDAVYVLEFSRRSIHRIGEDGKYVFDSNDQPVVEEILDSVAWVHANPNQDVCLSMQWDKRSSALVELLKNRRISAWVEYGNEKKEIDYNGLSIIPIADAIQDDLAANTQNLFSLKVDIGDTNLNNSTDLDELPPDYFFNISALVTVYKSSSSGACDA